MTTTYSKEQILNFIHETLSNHNYFIYHTLDCSIDAFSGFIYHYGFTLAKVPNQYDVIAYGYVDQATNKAYNDEGGETTLTELLVPYDFFQIKTLERDRICFLLTEILNEYNDYIDYGFFDNLVELKKIIKPFDYKIVTILKPDEEDEEEEIAEFGYLDTQTQKTYDVDDMEAKLADYNIEEMDFSWEDDH
ncbi:hypothetical protein [Shimazuella alba]|uniref:Uncharacterized protein n=1 Tax=Shimazuella alba TaxID=2690964 RepID=A0A6I4VZX7_9BACL|nr:hypothetical protein [Shimazuella alba]MXQ55276.1 hypothetical protein [Shimazuella alba]